MRLFPLLLLCSGALCAQQRFVLPTADEDCPPTGETAVSLREDIGQRVDFVATPYIDYYAPVPRSADTTAVVICPGGGYWIEAYDLEGADIARHLASHGYHAFVLAYRLPGKTELPCKTHVALDDAQRAMLYARRLADSLGYRRVGIMGFSAGGHLAGSASVHAITADGRNSRPDFSVLVYPVTLMDLGSEDAHAGSRRSLLGEEPDPALTDYYHLPDQVDSLTPPTLLVHASDDEGVPVSNSLQYYEALVRHGVPADLRVYASGGHGFGAARERRGEPVSGWLDELIDWMRDQ